MALKIQCSEEQAKVLQRDYPLCGGLYCSKLLGISLKELRSKVKSLKLTRIYDSSQRVCSKCNTLKSSSEFPKELKGKFGISSWCKICFKTKNNDNYYKNHTLTREKFNILARKQYLKYKQSNHPYLISKRLRHRIFLALKGSQKSSTTMELLGCSKTQLVDFLKSKLVNGMTWEKVMSGDIHIDHIKPCASFDLSQPDQQKICFHYTNLQPLWAKDNLEKGAKCLILP